MAQGRRGTRVRLSEADRAALLAWAGHGGPRQLRARIVLDADRGLGVSESARALGVARPTVTAWRGRYAAEGLAGLDHRPRSGRPPQTDEADAVATTLAGPPGGGGWTARALADRLGISHTTLGAVWRRWAVPRDPAGGAAGVPTVPSQPPLPCLRSELLAVWARGDGTAMLVLGQIPRPAGPQGRPAEAAERRSAHAALAAQLDRVRGVLAAGGPPAGTGHAEPPDGAPPPGSPAALIASAAARHPDRILHILTWGEPPDLGGAAGPVRHRATRAMSWPGAVCVLALAELAQFPGRFRPVLDALTESARGFADTPGAAAGFGWQRTESGIRRAPRPAAPPSRPRAFNQLALGSYNEKLVIESIREAVALSRVEIARRTGLTPQAVSRITRNLLTSGLLAEDERRTSGAGKPRVPLRLRPDAACAVGVHLDPEMITTVVVDLCGEVLERRSLPLERRDPQWCLARMADLALESARAAGPAAQRLLGVGVAVPGPLDAGAGVVVDPPLFEGWGRVPLRAELSRRLGAEVIVEKDATAAAIGERWLGAADRAGDFVYLYLGAGAGSGAFLNGDVYRGSTGNAGEVGELCAIRAGRLTADGGPRMVAECAPISAAVAGALAAGLDVPPGERAYYWVCEAAARGEPRAEAVLREVARVTALGAVGVVDLFDVDLLIVGGPAVLPSVCDIYLGEIASAVSRFPVARRVREVHVAHSRLNQTAASVGAASSVFHAAFAPTLHSRAARGRAGTGSAKD